MSKIELDLSDMIDQLSMNRADDETFKLLRSLRDGGVSVIAFLKMGITARSISIKPGDHVIISVPAGFGESEIRKLAEFAQETFAPIGASFIIVSAAVNFEIIRDDGLEFLADEGLALVCFSESGERLYRVVSSTGEIISEGTFVSAVQIAKHKLRESSSVFGDGDAPESPTGGE